MAIEPFDRDSSMLPEMLLVVSPSMKRMFKKYGSVVSLDFTYKLVRDIHPGARNADQNPIWNCIGADDVCAGYASCCHHDPIKSASKTAVVIRKMLDVSI